MKRYYGYVRASTNKQVDEGCTIQQQHDQIAEYTKRHGMPSCTEIFVDGGVSGGVRLAARPEGNRMLETLNSGDCVIVAHVDRLGRNLLDGLQTAYDLSEEGIQLHVCALGAKGWDIKNIQDKGFFVNMMLTAEIMRDLIGQRVRDAIQWRRANGQTWCPTPPHGKRLVKIPGKSRPVAEWDPERVLWVQRAFWLHNQGYAPTTICYVFAELYGTAVTYLPVEHKKFKKLFDPTMTYLDHLRHPQLFEIGYGFAEDIVKHRAFRKARRWRYVKERQKALETRIARAAEAKANPPKEPGQNDDNELYWKWACQKFGSFGPFCFPSFPGACGQTIFNKHVGKIYHQPLGDSGDQPELDPRGPASP